MDSGKPTDSTLMGGQVANYLPLIAIGGILAFIIGATVFCCGTGSGPKRYVKSAEEVERDLTPERMTKETKKSATKKSKADKKGKKSKKEPTEAELEKSINSLSKCLDILTDSRHKE